MTKDMDIDLEIEADEVAYIYLGTDKHNNLKNLDLPDSHPIRAITGLQEVVDKVGRTEDGAEVNEIIGVKVNGSPLDIAEDRTVDVPVPTSYGYYLDLDGNNGVISLKDRNGVVLSTIDTNLERIVKSGRYDADTNELVLVLDDNSEIRIDASKLVDVYTADGETIVETGHVFALSKGSKDALKDSADHIADMSNPHNVTKDQVGLSNVDNTSDMGKPISTLVQQALDRKADDSAVVHKTGDETIGGVKNFTGRIVNVNSYPNLIIQETSGEIATTTGEGRILFQDKNSNLTSQLGSKIVSVDSMMSSKTEILSASKKSDGSVVTASIGVYAFPDGTGYGLCTPVSNKSDNSNKIVTTNWANSASTLVHTTGNETIAGTKTFTEPPIITSAMVLGGNYPNYDLTELPSSRMVQYIPFRDKNGITNTQIESAYGTTGTQSLLLALRNHETGKWIYAGVLHDNNGGYATAPSWSVGTADNTDKIVTTKMANSLPSLVHTTGNETIAGTKTFTSAPVINRSWGTLQFVSPDVEIGYVPSNFTRIGGVIVFDKNNEEAGRLETICDPAGFFTSLTAKNKDERGNIYVGTMGIRVKKDGTIYSSAPVTEDTHPDDAIVTKKYLLDKIAALEARIATLEAKP